MERLVRGLVDVRNGTASSAGSRPAGMLCSNRPSVYPANLVKSLMFQKDTHFTNCTSLRQVIISIEDIHQAAWYHSKAVYLTKADVDSSGSPMLGCDESSEA